MAQGVLVGHRRTRFVGVVVLCATLIGVGSIVGARASSAATLPELRVADVTTAEGDAGNVTLKVPVTLSHPTTVKVKVPYTVTAAGDGVTDGHDFVQKNGQLTIAAGKTTGNVNVTWVGDTIVEPDQHVLVTLGTPVGGTATVADGIGEVTIVDDDSMTKPPGAITASIGDITMTTPDAGWVTGTIPVTLSRPATAKTKLVFALDCNALSAITNVQIRNKGTLVFAIGQRIKTVTFQVSTDGYNPQAIEDLAVNIQSQLSSVRVVDERGDVTINEIGGQLSQNQGFPVPNFAPSTIPGPTSFNAQSVGQIDQLTLTPSGGEPSYYWDDPNHEGGYGEVPGPAAASRDGRYIAFASPQIDLVAGDTNGLPDVFVRDRATNTTQRVSLRMDGSQIQPSDIPAVQFASISGLDISADGRYVVYSTQAQIDPRDHGPYPSWLYWNDVYLYDRVTHTTELESVDSSGNIMHGEAPQISADGRYVVFTSRLTTTDAVPRDAVYVRDRQAGTTTLVFSAAHDASEAQISANGRYVMVQATGLTCLDRELDVVDLSDGSTERVDVNDDGVGADDSEGSEVPDSPAISDDGRYVAFTSAAWNMVPGLDGPTVHAGAYDENLVHVYLRDRTNLSTTTVPLPPADDHLGALALSGDGRYLAQDNSSGNSSEQADLIDFATGTTSKFGPGSSLDPTRTAFGARGMSGDGRYVVFMSTRMGPPTTTYPTYMGDLFVVRIS